MKHDETMGLSSNGTAEDITIDNNDDRNEERLLPILACEGDGPTWGPNLEAVGAYVLDPESRARSQSWRRRSLRPWICLISRPTVS